MIDDWREVIRWAVLMLFVLLAAFILDGIANPVIAWVAQVIEQVVGFFGKPRAAEFISTAFIILISTSVHFAAGGFAYAWLVNVPWKRAAVACWLAFLVIRYAPLMPGIAGSLWFAGNAVTGLIAALIGARYFEEWRYNDHFVALRRRLHDRLQLA